MKARMEIVYVTQNAPKKNYLFFINDILYRITNVDNSNIYCEEVFENDSTKNIIVNIEFIKDNFIKFLAITDKLIFSIIRRDYSDIVNMLNTYFNSNSINSNEGFKKMIENKAFCNIEGKVIKISSKPQINSTVEICNINIIDNNNLYDKTSRLFYIQSFEYKKNNIIYTLCKDSIVVKCNRDSFKTINIPNYKNLFTLKI